MAEEKERLAILQEAHNDERFTYDLCMVFNKTGAPEEKKDCFGRTVSADSQVPIMTGPEIVARLKKAGLKVRLYRSIGDDEVYCLIGASEKRLELEADRIDLDLAFDKDKTVKIAAEEYQIKLAIKTLAKKEGNINPEESSQVQLLSDNIWDNIYGKFDPNEKKTRLYKRYNTDGPMHQDSFFRSTDRINLTVSIIEAPTTLQGAGLSINRLKTMKNTHLKAFFPMHEPEKLHSLQSRWLNLSGVWNPPLQEIRDYYGEKVALYFAFLNFYTKMLLIPSILGVVWIIVQRANPYPSYEQLIRSRALWLFAIMIIVWASAFLEMWKRKQAYFRVTWGMCEFKQKEQTRPEFRGEWVVNPVDGKLVSFFPSWRKAFLILVSQSVVISLIMCVVACVAGVFVARLAINAAYADNPSVASILGALINVFVIQFFNIVYGKVGKFLNEYENHRTDSEWENSMIGKSFLFKFVNSYNSLFYIAFFKVPAEINVSNGGGCKPSGGSNPYYPCLDLLSTQLLIVFGSMIVVNNFMEIVLPWIFGLLEAKKQQGDSTEDKSFPETEFERKDYESTFDDFDELAIQFGYVCLFVVALPVTPCLAFLNNLLEAYIDSSKLTRFDKRPEPRGCYDIGTWHSIFNVIAWISIMTNIGLVVLYTSEIREWSGFAAETKDYHPPATATAVTTLALVFFATEHLLALAKFAVEFLIPDEPEDVVAHIARQTYLVDLLIRDAQEEADDSEALMMAGDDGAGAAKTVSHAKDDECFQDGAEGDADPTSHLRVPKKCILDDHVQFKNYRPSQVHELATTPAPV